MVGLSWTLGFVTLAVGHLTIITVFIAPMLLGLADDFGVHFMTRYEEERGKGKDQAEAITIVFEQTVPSIIAGALTTSLAFFAVILADFRGVQELGIISGGGILLSVLAVLTFLPALIVGVDSFWPWRVSVGQQTLLQTTFSGWANTSNRRETSFSESSGWQPQPDSWRCRGSPLTIIC